MSPKATKGQTTATRTTGISRRTILEILIVLALLNTIVLIGVAVIGHKAYQKMEDKVKPFRPYTKVLDGSATAEEAQEVVHNLGEVLNAVVGDFILGASNGQLSAFISNILQKDFASFGFDYEVWSLQLERAFATTKCSRMVVTCPPYNGTGYYLRCPSDSPHFGRRAWCGEYYTETVTCDSQVCAAEYTRLIGSYVRTVARKLQQVHTLTSKENYPAAFSNGLFQLDGIFTWLQAQATIPAWKAAGQACTALAPKVKAVDWSGTYTNTDGVQQSWNANDDVKKVLGDVEQWCQGLANLPDSN